MLDDLYNWCLNEMTYSQRLELGVVLSSQTDTIVFDCYKVVYGKDPSLSELMHFELEPLLKGIAEWINLESEYLHYEPTPEEIQAGINNQECPLATAVSIGKDFGIMPNDVLQRPYSEIFSILWANAEQRKFERKLNKIMSRK